MKHSFLVIPALALALAGCQTPPKPTVDTPPPVETKIDNTIAQGAETLKAACFAVNLAIDLAQVYVESPKVIQALAYAETVAQSYCSGPTPSDIPSALVAIANAYRAVMEASPEIKAAARAKFARLGYTPRFR